MVDSKYISGNYMSLKISIVAVINNPEMLIFISDHLKNKKIRKHAVRKLSFIMRANPDRYQAQEMCDKTVLEIGGTLNSVPDCYINKKSEIKLLISMCMH